MVVVDDVVVGTGRVVVVVDVVVGTWVVVGGATVVVVVPVVAIGRGVRLLFGPPIGVGAIGAIGVSGALGFSGVLALLGAVRFRAAATTVVVVVDVVEEVVVELALESLGFSSSEYSEFFPPESFEFSSEPFSDFDSLVFSCLSVNAEYNGTITMRDETIANTMRSAIRSCHFTDSLKKFLNLDINFFPPPKPMTEVV